MYMLTIIITNFNCDLAWENSPDRAHPTSLKSTDKGLWFFNSAVIDDWYHNFTT